MDVYLEQDVQLLAETVVVGAVRQVKSTLTGGVGAYATRGVYPVMPKYVPYGIDDRTVPELTDSKELLTVKLRYRNPDKDVSKKLEIPVLANSVSRNVSGDFNCVMAVAMFGQLLKDSDFKGDATYAQVVELACKGLDEDKHGYRREFIRLVESVEQFGK